MRSGKISTRRIRECEDDSVYSGYWPCRMVLLTVDVKLVNDKDPGYVSAVCGIG